MNPPQVMIIGASGKISARPCNSWPRAALSRRIAGVQHVVHVGAHAAPAGIAALLSEVTGRPWRDEPRHPDRFLEAVVGSGADPVYLECVRNIFVRTAAGTLPDLNGTFDAVECLVGRPPNTMRSFLERHHRELS